MTIKEMSQISGVSVRTLHHYDAIGLLQPARNMENCYREYRQEDVDKLQQILCFKTCGFSLEQIQNIISDVSFDRDKAFQLQIEILLSERSKIDTMLQTIQRTMKEGNKMTNKEKFEGFQFHDNPYREEAEKRWGEDAIKSNQFIQTKNENEKNMLGKEMTAIFSDLAKIMNEDCDSEIVQKKIGEFYHFLNSSTGIHYTADMFAGIAQMYTCDERFQKNIDQFGAGLTEFISEAMQIYAHTIS